MGFLDLPVELFRPIVESVVLRCGTCSQRKHRERWDNLDIISLARVNTVLEWEVFIVLEKHHFFIAEDSMPSPSLLAHVDSTKFFARYLAIRPYPTDATWTAHFPALVNCIVDKFIQIEQPANDINEIRERCIRKLCHRACAKAMADKRHPPISSRPFQDHLLLAAIHLNKRSVVDELIYLRTDLSTTFSEFWRYPINAAIAIEDIDLIAQLIGHGAKWKNSNHPEEGWSCLEDAVRAIKSTEIVSLLYDEQGNSFANCNYELGNAINVAIKQGKEDLAHFLLDTQRDFPGSAYGEFWYNLRSGLIEACKQGMDRLVARLLGLGNRNNGLRWSGTTLNELVLTACRTGEEAVLKCLLDSNTVARYLVPHHDFLLNAALAGHVRVLRVLLDAGATLSATQAMKLLKESAPRPRCAEAVWYLLHRKAINVDKLEGTEIMVGYRVAHLMTAAAQRGNIEFLEALARYGVPLGDESYYTAADCPLPIVAAKAFRQADTIEALKELGVPDADPMQSIVVRHFRSGRYPCDPPPLDSVQEQKLRKLWSF